MTNQLSSHGDAKQSRWSGSFTSSSFFRGFIVFLFHMSYEIGDGNVSEGRARSKWLEIWRCSRYGFLALNFIWRYGRGFGFPQKESSRLSRSGGPVQHLRNPVFREQQSLGSAFAFKKEACFTQLSFLETHARSSLTSLPILLSIL